MTTSKPRPESLPPSSPLKKSYFHGACAEPLSGKTIGEVLEHEAELYPDRIAFKTHEFNEEITVKDLHLKAIKVAKALLRSNLKKGDLVIADNVTDIEYFSLYCGALLVGMIFISMKPRAVFIGRTHLQDALPIYKQYSDSLDSNIPLVFVNTNSETFQQDFLHLEDFLDQGKEITNEQFDRIKQQVSIDDAAVLFTSSGTTSDQDKSACVSHHTLVNIAKFGPAKNYLEESSTGDLPRINVAILSPKVDDAGALIAPIRCLVTRYTGVMAPTTLTSSPDSVEIFMTFVEKERVVVDAGLPFQLIHSMNSPHRNKYDLSSLKSGNLLGQVITAKTKAKLLALFPDSVTYFGATEAIAGCKTSLTYSTLEQRIHTVGRGYPHCEVKLVNDKDQVVPIGEQGEICVRGWAVFKGYYNDDNLTSQAKSLDKNGWYHYGDIGTMDETGHVTYIGRKSDCVRFKHYGDTVYPVKILSILEADDRISCSKVVGIPNDEVGDDICLCVEPKPNCTVTEDELKELMEAKLIPSMMPDYYFIFDEFPRVGGRQKVSIKDIKEYVVSKLKEMKNKD
ncbi:hypothetical protein ACF0H5_007672 [Mactra antiquata]